MRNARVVLLLAAAAVAACSDKYGAPTGPKIKPWEDPVYRVEIVSPADYVEVVGTVAAASPAVRVIEIASGQPRGNATVQFVAGTRSSVEHATAVTNEAGIASAGQWRFGTRAGVAELGVYLAGKRVATITAVLSPDRPDHLQSDGSEERVALAGQVVDPVGVIVMDRFSNPIPDVPVKFSVVRGAGTLQFENVTTATTGYARSSAWRLGRVSGVNELTASVEGLEPISFPGFGLDSSSLHWYELQTGRRNGAAAAAPSSFGISRERLGLTAFDPCLCVQESGYFIRMTENINGLAWSYGGRYQLNSSLLSGSYIIGQITGDSVVLTDDWDDFGIITWLFVTAKPE